MNAKTAIFVLPFCNYFFGVGDVVLSLNETICLEGTKQLASSQAPIKQRVKMVEVGTFRGYKFRNQSLMAKWS